MYQQQLIVSGSRFHRSLLSKLITPDEKRVLLRFGGALLRIMQCGIEIRRIQNV